MTRNPIDDIMLMDELKEHVEDAARLLREKQYKEAFRSLMLACSIKAELESADDD